MNPALLATKFYIPPVRTGAIPRPHLVERLTSGVQQPGCLILLSGPAGFGKTTLLSEFVAQSQQPTAWLSLDEGDSDPNRFWAYFITACQSVLSQVGETALDLLRAPQPLPENAAPTLLINDLASQAGSLVLVLDDYHTIQNPALHAELLFLLDHLPRNLHLIVSTRTDPPWPLSRYRARNQLIEIRAQELRFRLEEADEFLQHTMGLSLSAGELRALEERTEGWIAGLQLAALSMQGRSDIGAFIQAFTGSHVYIAEYLVDEVLKRQTEEMQAFLLQTSILDRLSAGLCEATAGCQDGQGKLKALQRANIFIVPLDEEGLWFRYHHLFGDLLKARLQSGKPKAAIEALHQRAATWYEQNEMSAEAVEHAIAAADYARVVRLMESAALPMILQAHVQTVDRWLQAIPDRYFENNLRINMAYAWMNLQRGTPLRAAPFITRLQAIFSSPQADLSNSPLRAEWLAIQAEHLISQGKLEESRGLAIQAQQMLPEVTPNVRSMVYLTLAKAYQLTLDYDRAAEIFQMIIQDARRMGDVTFEILGTSGQAQMVLKEGRLHQTYELVSEGIRRVEASGKKVPFSATLYGALGQVYFLWRKFDQAKEAMRRSVAVSGKTGYSDPEIYFHITLSKICMIEGDLDGAAAEMEQANQLASALPPAMVRVNMMAQQVWVDLAHDRPAAAERLLEAEGFSFGEEFGCPALAAEAPISLESGLLYNGALRVLLYHAKKGAKPANLIRGVDLAERVFASEFRCQHLPIALETLLLLSQMYAVLGQAQESQAAAARALELAEPEGFISPFAEEGQPVAEILAGLRKSGLAGEVRDEFLREVLAAFPNPRSPMGAARTTPPELRERPPSVETPDTPSLVEPLTARELEVLRLVAAGDSNQAIAEKLVITVSAVKKHNLNIYGKLGVNSRTQAISRARQLGLLAPDT